MTVHQCPKCELRFALKTELDDHCWHDHPEFRHEYPAEHGGRERTRHHHQHRDHEKYGDDRDGSSHNIRPYSPVLAYAGLNAHASISTAAPIGSAATPTVERAGRWSPNAVA